MKKVIIITVTLIALLLALQSCKSSEHCPAYGDVNSVQQVNKA